MTEDEAKMKWCPMVRFVSDAGDGGANRWPIANDCDGKIIPRHNPLQSRCIGSTCMMWRWGDNKWTTGLGTTGGYCGLGGKP